MNVNTEVKPLIFKVTGVAAPQGSKNSYISGGRVVMFEASKRHKRWRAAVTREAALQMEGREMFVGPVQLDLTFEMPRIKAHYRPDGAVRATAPVYCSKTPDLSKLVRSVEDSLQGIVFKNDSQVAKIVCSKIYADGEPGVTIVVSQLPSKGV